MLRARGQRALRAHLGGLCAAALLVAVAARADDDRAAYLAQLTAAADAADLAAAPEWIALLHYEPLHLGRGVRSTADTDWFFQAPDGRTDPRAELHATLARFFDPDATLRDGEPIQCALRARYQWLVERLAIDPARLPPQQCEAYDAWREALDADGVTLIFPEAYMNNPSSLFGHTLLRLDAGPSAGGSDLLAYGVNFSADTGADGGVPFAFKGIVGLYPGRFNVEPYYDVLTRYGDTEARDIWEYPLLFAPAEQDMLIAHLWELRGVEFDYYFFDENCSYQILALLDVARPSLQLTRQFPAWVIPADTVRAISDVPGLIGTPRYRPSLSTTLRHDARELPSGATDLVSQVADGTRAADDATLAELPARERAAVLGDAYELFRVRYANKRLLTPEEQKRARAILLARSQVPVEGDPLPPVPVPAVRPDQGHRSNRASLGTGVRDNQYYLEASIRPAYHDLLDPLGGYTAGAEIDFMELVFRYYTKHEEARVHRFTLVDIVSLTPWDAFFHPISWTVGTGLENRLLPNGHDDLENEYVWHNHLGGGLAVAPWQGAIAYGLAQAIVDWSPELNDNFAVGPQGRVGLFAGPPDDRWRAELYGAVTGYVLGDQSQWYQGGLDLRITLTPQMDLRGGINGNCDFDQDWIEGGISWDVFF
ncbi:MAG: DUF4105 domain-containing protein [Deltaproteobacteria bacterium]|nr:DUF4105 domain-containing protein [Deltaproteobacteria bacterium]